MSDLPTFEQLQQMDDEQIAELKQKLAKKLIRNTILFFAIKAAIYYALRRWTKAASKT